MHMIVRILYFILWGHGDISASLFLHATNCNPEIKITTT